MKSAKIFLVEDDLSFGSVLKSYLELNDFQVDWIDDGKYAVEHFRKGAFDICILDIMMPEMDGIKLAGEIRKLKPEMPVIFLTAKNQKEDIIEGFRIGADDYITKPFSMEELIYRIGAILRRTSEPAVPKKEEIYQVGEYAFDTLKQHLTYRDQTVKLTTKESELLELLCRHKNEVLERNYALKAIWIDDNYFNARSMDVYITKLRKYLKKDTSVRILNVHGKGYKLLA